MSTQTAGAWFLDDVKSLVVTLVVLSPVTALLYAAIRRFPRRWWVAAAAATPVLLCLLMVIWPVFVAPLFNTYKPLSDARIREPILSMARANGVPVDNVYQFDASRQSTRVSANVSGAFNTIRVSLNDNLLHRCTPAEIQAVMGHELGHYVLNHVYKLTIYISLLVAVGLAVTTWAYGKACARWGRRWGVRGPDDVAGLPLLIVVLSLFFLLATPASNTITRTTETEADIFGLNAARQPDGFAQVALKLADYRKLAPGPLEECLFYDHPSGYHRILMAMRWKSEHLADPDVAPR